MLFSVCWSDCLFPIVDDIDAVKEDLEAAFKHLSKKKGKMAKASRELQGVINGLDELQHSVVGEKRSLPMDDTGGGGSKRNRGTVAENSTEFTREQKVYSWHLHTHPLHLIVLNRATSGRSCSICRNCLRAQLSFTQSTADFTQNTTK